MRNARTNRFARMIAQGHHNARKAQVSLDYLKAHPGGTRREIALLSAIESMRYLRINLKLAEQDLEILKQKEATK